ncbi:hypothetical protein N7455_001152 [Penicillium solitum]|uniref:uncharacterized protein n=1 Tax=Penicillium solitum TaxID=60172 RepID=UPI0032C48BDC|nr:hypothetical protein N7536_006368 [Penicillium majusculum]KAJ5877687.1 hypothetical protein N7455_001152 [Penicillium solitum]
MIAGKNRIIRRVIIDRDEVAISWIPEPSISKPNTTLKLLFQGSLPTNLYIHHVSLRLQLLLRRVQLLLLLYLHSGSQAFTTAIFLQYNPYQTRAPTAVELAGMRVSSLSKS